VKTLRSLFSPELALHHPWLYALWGGALCGIGVWIGTGIADGRWGADVGHAVFMGFVLFCFFRWQGPRAARRRQARIERASH
jgi:hypothetical protein